MTEPRPLRIAMISYYLPSDSKIGVGYQVDLLARALTARGHEVVVHSPCPPVAGAPYGHRLVPLRGALRTFRFATALRRIDFSGFDVLHAHGDDYWMWRRRVPRHIRTVHGSCFEEARRIRGVKERLRMVLLGCSEVLASVVADATVVVSPATRRWVPRVTEVIPNGVDASVFRAEGARAGTPVVLFVGTWQGRKRGAALADAFARTVRPAVPDAQLWLVCQDAPADLPEGVRALGRVDTETLVAAYRQAWVFALPSSYEGFGIPYAEAMACGLPVVATPNVGARYVTDDGRCGEIVELEDLGPALVRLLTDAGERERLGELGRRRARLFDIEAVTTAYERLYRAR